MRAEAADKYFNEIDAVACAVLRAVHGGQVDRRSIKDVEPDDVRGFERCHFFAGAGLWDVAADMAGWRGPLWTASCPCQPFSVAGKGAGRDDPRHLWPDFFRLARAVRPPVIVGEQVAGAAGFDWFDGVASDLEGAGYACRAVDIPACTVDAPHRRQRLYWVAVSDVNGWNASAERQQCGGEQRFNPSDGSHIGHARNGERAEIAMADADCGGRDGRPENAERRQVRGNAFEWTAGGLGDADGAGLEIGSIAKDERRDLRDEGSAARTADNRSFWMDAEWLNCADGKARRAKPGIRLLVDGMAGRADLWRLAGNSIVPQIAAEVLAALAESLSESPVKQREPDAGPF